MEEPDIVDRPAVARRRLFGLQYLRAVAATGVVLFHATEAAGAPWRIGSRGIDLFFVLSGFLMIAITDGGARPWPFFKDRLLRIAPLYWIVTTALIMVAVVGLAPYMTLDPVRILTSFAFIPYGDLTAGRIILPILPVGWTLNAEMLFYTLFALILVLPRYRMLVLTCIICGLVTLGFLCGPTGAGAAWTQPILLEFVAGGWVGMAWVRPERRRRIFLFLLPALCVWTALPVGRVGAMVTLILAAVLFFEARGAGIPKWRPLLLLGDASYSIYLWQIFPLQFVFVLGQRLNVPPAILAIIASLAAIGGGILAYLLLERPLLALFHRQRTRHGITIPAGP
ncbi:MAG: acyltransferase [Candidatus Sphingomonas phytovorans]|nr:acyltransferase [Sphingomonas sp.]WEJ98446.1 MAG: acyltransferase [Sphingomonas sp.]